MAQYVNCNRCSFEFYGGHSHHTGASAATCVSCLSFYLLPTENPWGPTEGERIPLLLTATATRRKNRKGNRVVDLTQHNPGQDTGVFIAVTSETRATADHGFSVAVYPVENIPCPQCGKMTIVVGFDHDDQCPACGKQSLAIRSIIY